jgi:uncharacterized protein YbjT (DUF2867 family)
VEERYCAKKSSPTFKVRALVRNTNTVPDAIRSAELVQGDVTDLGSIRKAMVDVGVVYHCAGWNFSITFLIVRLA